MVAFAHRQIIVMIAHLMAKGSDLADDSIIVRNREKPEIIGPHDAQLMLNLCHPKGAEITVFDVVPEDD